MGVTRHAEELLVEPAAPPVPPRRSRWWVDAALVAALLPLAVLARRPGYLFSQPFWLDEGWVADSLRGPLRQLRLLTSSTPIGWTLLLRLVPHAGPAERLRALPLAFGALSVVAAYLFGRQVGGRPAAVAAGLAAALAPSALRNHTLKQYSADAFATLLLLWLTARVDGGWSRRRLLLLCLACVPLALVSHATVFVTLAAFGALALRALAQRHWARLGWVAAAGLGVAAVEVALYLTFAAAGDNAAMRRSWASRMIPVGHGLRPAADFVGARAADALGQVGFGPWPLAVAVVAAGLVALWRSRLPAVAVTVCLLAAELLAGALLQRYPFLDGRTSLFFTTLLTVCGALGVASVVAWSARRPLTLTLPLGLVLVVAAGALLLPAARAQALQPMPRTTVRQQVAYVLAHRRPGDTVLVGWAATYTFAWYWPERPTFGPTAAPTAVRFQPDYPGRPELVLDHWRSVEAVDAAVREAAARSRSGSGSGRVWLVLAEAGDSNPAWGRAAAREGSFARRQLPRLLLVGPAPGQP
ncbi:MAG TPA: hypothetical protein VFD04_07935 [Actinomycetes bacterium]|nr:hypothetical protein [Actinomycetes bacterium]